jgi:hypothetical protein
MNETLVHASDPIVVDLGRRKRKAIKQLKEGVGPAAAEVRTALATVKHPREGADVLPVVILYRKRGRKRRTLLDAILPRL